ncbi:uncharacterized protein LOC136035290 isoform X2 [Artemia franciscana]
MSLTVYMLLYEILTKIRENPLFIDDVGTQIEMDNKNNSDRINSDSSGYGSERRTEMLKKLSDKLLDKLNPDLSDSGGNNKNSCIRSIDIKKKSDLKNTDRMNEFSRESTDPLPAGFMFQNPKFVRGILVTTRIKPIFDSYESGTGPTSIVLRSLPSVQIVPKPVFPKDKFDNTGSEQRLEIPLNRINHDYVANILVSTKYTIPSSNNTTSLLNNSLLGLEYSYNSIFVPEKDHLRDSRSDEEAIRELSESLGKSQSVVTVTNALKNSQYMNFDSFTSHYYHLPNVIPSMKNNFGRQSLRMSANEGLKTYVDVESAVARKVTFSEETVENSESNTGLNYESEKDNSDPYRESKYQVHEHLRLSHYGVYMEPVRKEKSILADQQRIWENYYGVPDKDIGRYHNGLHCKDSSSTCIDFTLDAQRLVLIAEKEKKDTVYRRMCCSTIVLLGIAVFVIIIIGIVTFFAHIQEQY